QMRWSGHILCTNHVPDLACTLASVPGYGPYYAETSREGRTTDQPSLARLESGVEGHPEILVPTLGGIPLEQTTGEAAGKYAPACGAGIHAFAERKLFGRLKIPLRPLLYPGLDRVFQTRLDTLAQKCLLGIGCTFFSHIAHNLGDCVVANPAAAMGDFLGNCPLERFLYELFIF